MGKKQIVPPVEGLRIPLPEYELVLGVSDAPHPGASTERFRVLQTSYEERKLVLTVESRAGSDASLGIRHNGSHEGKKAVDPVAKTDAEGGKAEVESSDCTGMNPQLPRTLFLHFPDGEGWKIMQVTLTW
jgi:hypothetical protein